MKQEVIENLAKVLLEGDTSARMQASYNLLNMSLPYSNKIIIQVLGQARSGKDWTSYKLQEAFKARGVSAEVMSYAAPMKRIAAKLFGISLDTLDDFKNRSDNVSIEVYDDMVKTDTTSTCFQFNTNFREILQRLGNDAIKPEFGDDVWAQLALKNINASTSDVIIMSDCRFNVELEAVGGVTIRVLNQSLPEPMNHPSELELRAYETDYVINNTDYKLTDEQIVDLVKRIIHDRANS